MLMAPSFVMYNYNPSLTSFFAPRLAAWYCLLVPIAACAWFGRVELGSALAVAMVMMVAFRRSSSSLIPLLWVAWLAGS